MIVSTDASGSALISNLSASWAVMPSSISADRARPSEPSPAWDTPPTPSHARIPTSPTFSRNSRMSLSAVFLPIPGTDENKATSPAAKALLRFDRTPARQRCQGQSRPDLADADEEAEQIPFLGGREAEQLQDVLPDVQVGEQEARLPDRRDIAQGDCGHLGQEADPSHVDHHAIGVSGGDYARKAFDHGSTVPFTRPETALSILSLTPQVFA